MLICLGGLRNLRVLSSIIQSKTLDVCYSRIRPISIFSRGLLYNFILSYTVYLCQIWPVNGIRLCRRYSCLICHCFTLVSARALLGY